MLLRTVTSCLLVVVLLVSRTWQQSIPGFSNVSFTVQPQDRYLLPTGSTTSFSCGAEGISNTTNSSSPIQIIMYIDDVQLDVFEAPPRFFVFTDGGPLNIPTAVDVSNIVLADNGMTMHCQVADCPKDGSPCIGLGINSTIANLVVADGRPPAIPLTQTNSTIRSVTVEWPSVLLPKSGPLTSYNVTLIDSQSNQTLSHELIANPVNVFEHTFVDLDPETSYRVNVVGINQYGAGNRTAEPLKITTAAPQVPGPPVGVVTKNFPVTQILVTWKVPPIDSHKQTPVTHYVITYHPVDLPQNITSINTSALQYIVPAKEADTNYSISISAVNTAGLSLPALVNIETAPTNITPSIPQQVVPQTSSADLQITSSIMPTPSFTPIISISTSSITTSSLSLSTSSAAAFTSTTSSIVAVVSTTSRVISTSVSDQPSRTSIISNVLPSVVMETPTQPLQTIPDPTAASVVIIASAAVALALIVVIMIIAIALIVVCVKNLRHDTAQVDLPGDLPKEWNSTRHDNKRASFLKDGSSVSSDSNELSNRSSLSQEAVRPNEAEV